MDGAAQAKSGWGFLPLAVGIALALVSSAVALYFTLTEDVRLFPEIVFACARNGLDAASCQTGAIHAGWTMVGVHGASLGFLALLFWRLRHTAPPQPHSAASEPKTALIAAFMVIPLAHLLLASLTLETGSRIDDIQRFAIFISLENAFWPLWIHFYVTEKAGFNKSLLLIALLLVLMLTPFRAVGMAIILFAFVIPFMRTLWQSYRGRTIKHDRKSILKEFILLLFMVALIGINGYQDSKNRTNPTLFAKAVDSKYANDLILQPDGTITPTQMPRLHQRLSYPLYQAGMVEHLSKTQNEELPGITDELLRKVHLSDKPTLNEYVYQRIYMEDGVGQTTSLTFGEAAAYFPQAPYLWMIGAPFVLIGLWFMARRHSVVLSTLIGIALWRSSQAGFITIIPSLTLQLALYGALLFYDKLFSNVPFVFTLFKKYAFKMAVVVLALAIGVGCHSILYTLTSPGARVIVFKTLANCSLDLEKAPKEIAALMDKEAEYHLQLKPPHYFIASVRADEVGEKNYLALSQALNRVATCKEPIDQTHRVLSERNIMPTVNPILLALLGVIAFVFSRHLNFRWTSAKIS